MKKGIRYLRFSSDGQSHHSIQRQDMITEHWMTFNKVQVIDTFTDEGYTAKTFDRPDIKTLFDFIRKNHHGIDYLVVSELTRFSREAGDAINMVKKIQAQYGVRIVSASRGAIYDCLDHNSFFMMGLEFLLGNSENIKRQNDINGGIYTAKAIKGKWIQGGPAPFGYRKEGAGDDRRLIIDEEQASIVRFIFNAFLGNTPIYVIKMDVDGMGFKRRGNARIHEILSNPLYAGYQQVKPWKDNPGGLFQVKNAEPIIDMATWNRVQQKLKAPDKPRMQLSEDLPLRGVLLCHCKTPLTGAASRGKAGKYFNYYKCKHRGHNNISATKAHDQLHEAFGWMSLPERIAIAVREQSLQILDERTAADRKVLQKKTAEFERVEKDLASVEEKWIRNQISHEAYHRWHTTYSDKRIVLRSEIERLNRDENELYFLLQEELIKLTDLQAVYSSAATVQKQELVRMVFDSSLYYQDGCYRTPYLLPVFRHNHLILKQKQLLVFDGYQQGAGEVEASGFLSNTFTNLLSLVKLIRVA
ncbi:MAG TPA: recombinase family protein [Chitinophagaceae bacterium]|nr:recombinase family protein [Chitinophagaceae bacterium]